MMNSDFLLSGIQVEGEVSNTVYHRSGHLYFTLKDPDSSLECAMFAGSRRGLAFPMKDGDRVVVSGNVDVYEKTGTYKLYAKKITPAGIGVLYERFLALKKELEERGMFAEEYKKPLPFCPKTIGVVTAATGAAIRDIQNISRRRNPGIQIILYPAIVQGEQAAESIVKGIEVLDRRGVDVIIVGRGGGSIEDLWAFNEESVAYAIFHCNTPVISAVGHETDFTIADFAADLRAPTPSAAAELAVTDLFDVIENLNGIEKHLSLLIGAKLEKEILTARSFEKRLNALSPVSRIRQDRESVQRYCRRIMTAGEKILTGNRHRLGILAERLDGSSPLKKLRQGFSYVSREDGRTVTSVSDAVPGDELLIHVTDGIFFAGVNEIKKTGDHHG